MEPASKRVCLWVVALPSPVATITQALHLHHQPVTYEEYDEMTTEKLRSM